MSRILTARIDPRVLDELNETTRRLGITKKQFLEEAIRLRAAQEASNVWEDTRGAWKRDEDPDQTVAAIRESFRATWERREQLGDDPRH